VGIEDAAAILLVYFGMLFMSMVAHEYAHAWTATRAGDYTAWDMGRLTFNPLAHVDLFWTLIMPAVALWTGIPLICGPKPIPTNPYNYNNLIRDYRIVAGAGLVVNAGIAVVLAISLHVLTALKVPLKSGAFTILGMVLLSNLLLMLFNLLPVPPLDGSRLVRTWLPDRWSDWFDRMDRWGLIILIVLINIPGFFLFIYAAMGLIWIYVLQLDPRIYDEAVQGYLAARDTLLGA
jgi:Zn-dependent protease